MGEVKGTAILVLWYNKTTAERKLGVWTVSKVDYGYAVAPMTRPPRSIGLCTNLGVVVFNLVDFDHVIIEVASRLYRTLRKRKTSSST